MSRDVLTVGFTMRIPLLYQGEYSQWSERFMNYLEEQTNREAMINSIKNGDQPLPRVTQVSIAGTLSTEQPLLKDKSMCNDEDISDLKKITALLAKLFNRKKYYAKPMNNNLRTSSASSPANKKLEYVKTEENKKDKKVDEKKRDMSKVKCYNCKKEGHFAKDCKKEKQNQRDVNDAIGLKKKNVVVTSDPLALITENTKITALLAKAFNQKKFYSKPTNNYLRTSSATSSANKKQEFVKSDDKKEEKKVEEKKKDMSKVKCYNYKKKGHFVKDCKKAKVKDYEYYKTKMLLAKKDKDEQVLLTEDHAWMKSRIDLDQEINSNMVFMAQIEKVFSDSEASSSSVDDKIAEPLYLLYMDLCGPMRIESINGKRYVLVVIDDFSRYTWVFFLHSKEEASEVIISFINKTQVNLQLQVQRVQTNNGTQFKNKTLAKFFNEAEAIATTCFTQNHSISHKRFDKTPYEVINKRKPNIKFFHVFGCRCYLLNDYDDVGKLKAKGDIGVFVGYLEDSAAFRVYNK
nr:hypothetical protein [Tanacetum cinerariifolium]